MAWTWILGMCALWLWSLRYDLGSRSWHNLGSWTTMNQMLNIIQIQHCSEEMWPGHGFWLYVHCNLDLGDMTLAQGHDTLLGHGQQVCVILSRYKMVVRSYGLDMDFRYVCTVTLALRIWPRFKVMTLLGHGQQLCEILYRSDKGVRSYGQDTMWTDGWTNRQMDRVIPI